MMAEAMRHLRLLTGAGPVNLIELHGTLERTCATPVGVTALYAGEGLNQDFLAHLVLDRFTSTARQTLRSYWALRAALSDALHQVDVVLTDVPPLWSFLTPAAAQFRFPAWVSQELTLSAAEKGPWLLPRAVEREAARYTRRHDYRVDFVADQAVLREFYHELYRPYVQARFDSGAIAVEEKAFMAVACQGILARLKRAHEWVAGVLLTRSQEKLKFGWFGARSSPPPPGASDVLDVACVRYAQAQGIERIVLGHSRASLVNGVVRYKSKLGAQLLPTRFPQGVLGISVRPDRTELLHHLNQQQLIAFRHGKVQLLQAGCTAP